MPKEELPTKKKHQSLFKAEPLSKLSNIYISPKPKKFSTQAANSKFFEEINLEKKTKIDKKLEVKKWDPIMVLSNRTSDTIVLKTIDEHANQTQPDLGLFLTESEDISDIQQIYNKVNKAITETIHKGDLKPIQPQPLKKNKINYKYGTNDFIQEKTANGKFKFIPESNFCGILRVQRKKTNGKLDPNQADIIEYKNGEPIAVTLAKAEETRIADIGLIQKKIKSI
ncbi:MAG: hypothetical protein HRU36_04875 [Rickettsiales bacterium]|nr:hypothetical protein [Rickettsiales bacterium]